MASSALDLHLLCIVIIEKREDDCEVDAGIYEVGLHGKRRGATFVASMSAGRILKSPIVKRVRKEKN